MFGCRVTNHAYIDDIAKRTRSAFRGLDVNDRYDPMPDAPKQFGPAVQFSFGVAHLKYDPLSCDLTQIFWPVKLVMTYSPGEDAASTLTRVLALSKLTAPSIQRRLPSICTLKIWNGESMAGRWGIKS